MQLFALLPIKGARFDTTMASGFCLRVFELSTSTLARYGLDRTFQSGWAKSEINGSSFQSCRYDPIGTAIKSTSSRYILLPTFNRMPLRAGLLLVLPPRNNPIVRGFSILFDRTGHSGSDSSPFEEGGRYMSRHHFDGQNQLVGSIGLGLDKYDFFRWR